ncbi:MAG: hypothetical protein DHS20C18_16240 [Saprospiraceae bacterium]|nr:MAG: hypothetical protein DHS20C18_16240 [Saprospiraceae bacterium]
MKLLILSILLSLSCLTAGLSQADFEKRIQTELIMVETGDVVELPPGTFMISGSLLMDGKKNVTIKGAGREKTYLSFSDQQRGAEGIKITNSENITLEDFTIQDTKGDCIKVQDTKGITFRNVRAEWTGKASKKNGAYGLYPVQCEAVLIEGCEAIGASDAGIYVGQSHQIVVRKSRAYRNVAGIEIENSTMADVYENVAEGNTGGILVFDLPGLIKKKGGNVRVFNNIVSANNYKNFAPKGNTVGQVAPGTGILILAASDVEIFDNQIIDNKTVGTGILSYFFTEKPIEDEDYYPYPARISIHDNVYEKGDNGKMQPTWKHKVGFWLYLKFGRKVPNILYDGIVEDDFLDTNGHLKPEYQICLKNNTNGTFLNLNAREDLKSFNTDVTGFECEQPALKPADLVNN